jgi:four helix bundle protein
VYQRALGLVQQIQSATQVPARGHGHLISQLRRAAASVPLNIAEGYGRWNKAEKKRFYLIARGSCFECIAALELCFRVGVVDQRSRDSAREDLDQIGKMLTGLIRASEE